MLNTRENQATLVAPSPSAELADLFFSFDGRIGRARFIGAYLASMCAAVAGILLISAIVPRELTMFALLPLFGLGAFSGFALTTKRWHDLGYSGWMQLLSLIPYLGGLACFVALFMMPGTDGPNAYDTVDYSEY